MTGDDAEQESILAVDGLNAGYGEVRVLRDVAFEVEPGEVFSIIGPNGAGKTTLMRALMGLIDVDAGEIRVGGVEMTDAAPHERVVQGVSLVSEERNLFDDMTVAENLKLGAYRSRDAVSAERERVYELFPRLDERRTQKVGTLSGGEQQMLAIGRGLMVQPDVLLLDEPSLGLAPILVPELFEKVQRINDDGVSVVIVEQRARKALEAADRGCLLENGEITHRGDADDMLDDETVEEKYLGGAQ